jgi:excisionase family DNA binding protein
MTRKVNSTIAPPQFYSIDEVANFLGVSPRTLRRWIKSGELRAHQFGRPVRILHDDLEAFVARQEYRSDENPCPGLSRPVRLLRAVGKTPTK